MPVYVFILALLPIFADFEFNRSIQKCQKMSYKLLFFGSDVTVLTFYIVYVLTQWFLDDFFKQKKYQNEESDCL
jgi:hypothetical protein